MSCKSAAGRTLSHVLLISVLAGLLALAGCHKELVEKDYARELPAGTSALRKVDPSQWPDLTAAVRHGDHVAKLRVAPSAESAAQVIHREYLSASFLREAARFDPTR